MQVTDIRWRVIHGEGNEKITKKNHYVGGKVQRFNENIEQNKYCENLKWFNKGTVILFLRTAVPHSQTLACDMVVTQILREFSKQLCNWEFYYCMFNFKRRKEKNTRKWCWNTIVRILDTSEKTTQRQPCTQCFAVFF